MHLHKKVGPHTFHWEYHTLIQRICWTSCFPICKLCVKRGSVSCCFLWIYIRVSHRAYMWLSCYHIWITSYQGRLQRLDKPLFILTKVFGALCTPASTLKEQHTPHHWCGCQKGCKRKHISYVVEIVIVILSDWRYCSPKHCQVNHSSEQCWTKLHCVTNCLLQLSDTLES